MTLLTFTICDCTVLHWRFEFQKHVSSRGTPLETPEEGDLHLCPPPLPG